jgi:hypothetical protein
MGLEGRPSDSKACDEPLSSKSLTDDLEVISQMSGGEERLKVANNLY